MGKCDKHCIHKLQLAWVTDDAALVDSRIRQLFGPNTPVWRQTCSSSKADAKQASRVLRDLMTTASRLLQPADSRQQAGVRDMAAMWATELPLVVTTQLGDSVLGQEGGVHVVVHLLYLAYRNGDISFDEAFGSVCAAADALASGQGGRLWERDRVWTVLLEFGGVLLARQPQLDNRSREAGMRLGLLAVSVVGSSAGGAQTGVLALVYTLHTRHNCDVTDLVCRLATACAEPRSQRELKVETGHLVLALYGDSDNLPVGLAHSVYALQSDPCDSVRAVWGRLGRRAERPMIGSLGRALWRDANDADGGRQALSAGDAMLVVKAVVESAGEGRAADVGLSRAALDSVLALALALGCGQKGSVFEAVDGVVGAASRRLRKLTLEQRQLLAALLLDAVRSCMARPEAGDGLYWVLVLMSHLCLADGAGQAGLLGDSDCQLLLLKAADASSNLAFGVFALQVALGSSKDLDRLASAAPWPTISRLLSNEAGDAVDLLLQRTNRVDDVRDALYDVTLNDISACGALLSTFDENSDDDVVRCDAALLAGLGSVSQTLVMYVESHADGLTLANRLLGGSVWRALQSATPSGAISHRHAVSFLLAADRDSNTQSVLQHWRLYVAGKVFGAYAEPSHTVATPAEVLFSKQVVACVSANDRAEILFAQRLPASTVDATVRLFVADLDFEDAPLLVERITARGVDATKAREALLYARPSSAATDALYTHLLLEGSGRIRFTASGTFDVASRLIGQMTASPAEAPTLTTDTLNANAVRQLAPFIPQLLAMLRHAGAAGASALAMLQMLAVSAPDVILLHAIVASMSLPDGGSALLRLLGAQAVADARAFLALAGYVAAPPLEQLRWLCARAKAAYDRAAAAYAQGKFSAMPHRARDAFAAPLQPALQFLAEHTEATASPAEAAFRANTAFFLQALRSLEEKGPDVDPTEADRAWQQVFARFEAADAAAVATVSHFSPLFSAFAAAVPIPMLTDPAEPLYFHGVSDALRVIKSKTSPKLLSFLLASRDNNAVSVNQYILKGSEDLRVDECVMQTFVRLNRVVASSASASSLTQLAVYNVVPIGVLGGLIEVVENAPTLFHIYSQNSTAIAKYGSLKNIYMRHALPVLRRAGLPDSEPFAKWPADVARLTFDSLLRSTPASLLHHHLLRASPSPSSLHLAAKNMVKSIAMASIAGYVVGLGDRHIGNLLVCAHSGQLVNIDFSVSFDFGSASTVPEQVPFRLTPVFEYLCGGPTIDATEVASKPFAMSRVFERSATATLLFARLDREALRAIARRVLFAPFAEWSHIEESWLRDRNARNNSHSTDLVRATGLCPPNGFWPPHDLPKDTCLPVTDIPFGWRIAHAAVSRMDARLDYRGDTEHLGSDDQLSQQRSHVDLVHEQFAAAWNAATCKDRLSKMFIGWGSWI
ncbi:hypothetical protein GGI20_002997 [Coemansia sp. BCRC 34301]|nr:hypothetical protein GGI20_002997 [Coemansia sp. BCRC 34301]